MRFTLSILGTEVFEFGEPSLTVDELVHLGLSESEPADEDEKPAFGFVPPEEATC
jgi:hypothetical protein